MKIERINDKQIRCTISKEDLAERKIKLSELACGIGNSKELFKDMIRQAAEDFGFEVDDIPLMIEAIPVSPECIILILTKVDNPEETESHFAKLFGNEHMDLLNKLEQIGSSFDADSEETVSFEELDDFDSESEADSEPIAKDDNSKLLFSIYSFVDLNQVIHLSKMIHPVYQGDSALFKSPINNKYYLSLCTDTNHEASLKYATSLLSEYGTHEYATYTSEFFFLEHFEKLIPINALEKLAEL